MASNEGDFLYVGPWGPGPHDSAQRMFDTRMGQVNKTQVTGFEAYRKNALTYQGLVNNRTRDASKDTARNTAAAAASGTGLGSVAARNRRSKFEGGMSEFADMPNAPTAPDVQAPVRTYIDPRNAWRQFNIAEGVYADTGDPGSLKRGVEGYNEAYNEWQQGGQSDPSKTGSQANRFLFGNLNRELHKQAETLGDFKLLTELGQPAWSPQQFDTMKKAADDRYDQDVKDYEELQKLKSTTIDRGNTGDPDYQKYVKDKEGYDAASSDASRVAGAAGGKGQGATEAGIGQGVNNTSPGMEFVKLDDNEWI